MTSNTEKQGFFDAITFAVKQFILRKKIAHCRHAIDVEYRAEKQAYWNGEWYKLQAHRLEQQLKEMTNAAE